MLRPEPASNLPVIASDYERNRTENKGHTDALCKEFMFATGTGAVSVVPLSLSSPRTTSARVQRCN